MYRKTITTAAIVGGLFFGLSTSALACNSGTTNGNSSNGCNTVWNAHSMHSDTAQDYPEALTKNVDGSTAAGGASGGNWGYFQDVTAGSGTTGAIFEINHFHPNGANTFAWRIPVATEQGIDNAKVTVRLPGGLDYNFDSVSTNANMVRWGGDYAKYTWASKDANVIDQGINDKGEQVYVVELGNLAAGTGTVFQFSVKASTPLTARQDAYASLAGNTANCSTPVLGERPIIKPGVKGQPEKFHYVNHKAIYQTPKIYGLVQRDQYNDFFIRKGKKVPMDAEQKANREQLRKQDKAAGKLLYRKGSASTWLWGSTTPTISSMNICALPKVPANTDLWLLGKGATKKDPWGAKHNIPQLKLAGCQPKLVKAAWREKVIDRKAVPAQAPVYGDAKLECPTGTTMKIVGTDPACIKQS